MENIYHVKDYIIESLKELNFKEFTDIQKKVIPNALKNQNIIGTSKTGSGKTHSFLIPLFNKIKEDNNNLQGLIILPTKEIARQTYEFCKIINKYNDNKLDIKLYIGGNDKQKEINKLNNKNPQIAIGTPGRLYDLIIKEKILQVQNVETLILDEADMILDIGFLKEVDEIINKIKKPQFLIFSATLPPQIKAFLKKLYKNNYFIEIKGEDFKTLKIKNFLIKSSDEEDKYNKFLNIINNINPYMCLIFCNNYETCNKLYQLLSEYDVGILHKNIKDRQRKNILNNIKKLKYQYVVCTDLASRGLDIIAVSHIINFDLPKDIDFFFHRIGRTGRNNMDGLTYSIYLPNETNIVNKIKEKGINFINLKASKNSLIELK